MFINEGGAFRGLALPEAVQYSTANALAFVDLDGDRQEELLIGGNFYALQPELGRYDASYGHVLKWERGAWHTIPYKESGLHVRGQVKHILSYASPQKQKILLVRNNDKPLVYEWDSDL